MFGGYGVYKEGVIIALMDEGELYFKSTPTFEPGLSQILWKFQKRH
jgi:TfoX/Sxy family transcriptional regulator of competence genes